MSSLIYSLLFFVVYFLKNGKRDQTYSQDGVSQLQPFSLADYIRNSEQTQEETTQDS